MALVITPLCLRTGGKERQEGETGLPLLQRERSHQPPPGAEAASLFTCGVLFQEKTPCAGGGTQGADGQCSAANTAFLEWTEKWFQNPKVNGTLLHDVDEGK